MKSSGNLQPQRPQPLPPQCWDYRGVSPCWFWSQSSQFGTPPRLLLQTEIRPLLFCVKPKMTQHFKEKEGTFQTAPSPSCSLQTAPSCSLPVIPCHSPSSLPITPPSPAASSLCLRAFAPAVPTVIEFFILQTGFTCFTPSGSAQVTSEKLPSFPFKVLNSQTPKSCRPTPKQQAASGNRQVNLEGSTHKLCGH